MSRNRRRAARYRTAVRVQTKAANRQVTRNLTDRHPLKFLGRWPDGYGTERTSRRPVGVLLAGEELEIRDRAGRLVFAERSPDYYVPYESWARAVWTRPRPLPRPLLAKVGRRR